MLLHFWWLESRLLIRFVKFSVTENKIKNLVLRKGDIETNKYSNMTNAIIKIYSMRSMQEQREEIPKCH
jgi:hypothetical protein